MAELMEKEKAQVTRSLPDDPVSGIPVWQTWLHAVYVFCYIVGSQTIRNFRICKHRLRVWLAPILRFFYLAAQKLVVQPWRKAKASFRHFLSGFKQIGDYLTAKGRSPLRVIMRVFLLPVAAIRRHRQGTLTLTNVLAPVLALALLVTTVLFWQNREFGLALEYEGEFLGYIENENVYTAALEMANERINYGAETFQTDLSPVMTLSMIRSEELTAETELCDDILRLSGTGFTEMSGLYIDGEFSGAMSSRTLLRQVLDHILDAKSTDFEDETIEFVQKVEIVEGLYASATALNTQRMLEHLTTSAQSSSYYKVQYGDTLQSIADSFRLSLDELLAANEGYSEDNPPRVGTELVIQQTKPRLQIQAVRNEVYTEPIAYTSRVVYDDSHYVGYRAVQTSGQNGEREITAKVAYLDDEELSREVLSEKVVKDPVTEVIVVGTMQRTESNGSGVATGTFIWPIPAGQVVSSPYGARDGSWHNGVDLSGGVFNKPIIAADGGTVVEANATDTWGMGYGLSVVIDHGNGYRTRYAHMNSVSVAVGMTVAQGEEIGRAGNTGRSFGPHLHFEIIVNGTRVDPLPFIR